MASQVLGTPCPWVWLSGTTAHRPSCVPFFRLRDFSFVTAGLAELTLRPHHPGGLGLRPSPPSGALLFLLSVAQNSLRQAA